MKREGSLPCSKGAVTGPCPEPDASSPQPQPYFPKIHVNIIFLSTPRSFKWSLQLFEPKYCRHFSSLPSPLLVPLIHSSSVSSTQQYFWRRALVMKLLIMQSSPASRHFLPLWCKCSQRPVLKHPRSMFFP
jgi:hypothetical protein